MLPTAGESEGWLRLNEWREVERTWNQEWREKEGEGGEMVKRKTEGYSVERERKLEIGEGEGRVRRLVRERGVHVLG